jgi:putative hydrolase of the HAD superfamily
MRAVVFDLFDTLVDLAVLPPGEAVGGRPAHPTARRLHAALAGRIEVPFEALALAMREVDTTLLAARHAEGREVPTLERMTELAARLGIADSEVPELLTRTHMAALRETASTPAHHAGALAALRAAGLRLGVCSNFSHAATARALLAEAGLLPLLDAVVISEEVDARKPRREIFEATLARLGAAPGETLHVGDRLDADVAGAAAVGCRTGWLVRRVRDREAALARYAGPPPDLVLADLAELPARLGDR